MENIKLLELSDDSLEELLLHVNNKELTFEDKLSIEQDNNLTFGLEIEFENADYDNVLESMNNYPTWSQEYDLSVSHSSLDKVAGGEIISPVLQNNETTWKELKEVCTMLEKHGAKAGIFSAGHIHIGSQILGSDINDWLTFVKLWAVYEKVVYRFAYGERNKHRPLIDFYAKPLTLSCTKEFDKLLKDKTDINDLYDLKMALLSDKNRGLNFQNVITGTRYMKENTIEMRNPNSTLNPAIWQNNVNFFAHLMLLAKKGVLDKEKLDDQFKALQEEKDIKKYGEVYLPHALELCDMMYDNSTYKLNFLKQYLKLFANTEKEYIPTLIKKK